MSARPFRAFPCAAAQQQVALQHPCRLAFETMHPRFAWREGGHGIILTVNSGYE